jgi:hypothetical protein
MPRGPIWTDQEDRALIKVAKEYKQDVPKLMKAYANKVGHARSLGGIATRLRLLADDGRISREIAMYVGQYYREPMGGDDVMDEPPQKLEPPKPVVMDHGTRKESLEWILRGVDLGMLDAESATNMVKKVLK